MPLLSQIDSWHSSFLHAQRHVMRCTITEWYITCCFVQLLCKNEFVFKPIQSCSWFVLWKCKALPKHTKVPTVPKRSPKRSYTVTHTVEKCLQLTWVSNQEHHTTHILSQIVSSPSKCHSHYSHMRIGGPHYHLSDSLKNKRWRGGLDECCFSRWTRVKDRRSQSLAAGCPYTQIVKVKEMFWHIP